ncbi:MAG: hypothetical protein RLZZ338_4198 [Cyanobacteriota bacterium]
MSRVRAPDFPQNAPWLNTDKPLSLAELKGRVVILDFWTYCCINCLHILPDLKYLEEKYQDSLTVIGIHCAKFENEKDVENIRQAILRYDIEHPVLVDSDFTVWQEYAVRAWPTLMIIDPEGYVIGYLAGEGNREILDDLLPKLINEHQQKKTINYQEISFMLEKQNQPLVTPLAFPGKVLAVKKGDRVFIADTGHHRIIVSKTDGEVLQIIGNGKPGLINGSFSDAQFFAPQGMTFDEEKEYLYVADTENHVLRKIDLKQETVETIAGTGSQSHHRAPHSGNALETPLNSPWDLIKIRNNVFIAMAGSHQIWKMDLETGIIETYAGIGQESCVDGNLLDSAFSQPSGITSDGLELFITDSEISSIRGVGIKHDTQVRTICGSGDLFGFGDVDGHRDEVRLQHCLGIEYTQNYVWIADTYNHKIKRLDHRTGLCLSILGDGTPGCEDGIGENAKFFEPSGLSAIGPYLFVADTNNHLIRKINLEKSEVTTLEFPGLCAPDICFPNAS